MPLEESIGLKLVKPQGGSKHGMGNQLLAEPADQNQLLDDPVRVVSHYTENVFNKVGNIEADFHCYWSPVRVKKPVQSASMADQTMSPENTQALLIEFPRVYRGYYEPACESSC